MHDSPSADREPGAQPAASRPRFRRSSPVVRLEPGISERHGRATTAAFLALGSERARAFMNGHDDVLDGRPIDIAGAGEPGLAAVEARIRALTSMAVDGPATPAA